MHTREDVLRWNKSGLPTARVDETARAEVGTTRRAFIKVSATATGGLLVSLGWEAKLKLGPTLVSASGIGCRVPTQSLHPHRR
jgi:hypothetical protein